MARTLEDMMAALPPEDQAKVDAGFQEMKGEVESLRALRQIAGKAQADVAAALHIRQPSVSRIERQADMYLSTLRSYIEAIGGELELTVRLPDQPPLRLQGLGDISPG
jgi:DNA-binding XRE family transcriptional regulator